MARSFKLKCRFFISSFRFCRPKQQCPLTFPENPHNYKQFPDNPKSCDVCYPNPPSPPPSTPVGFFTGHSTAKSVSVCCSCKLKSHAGEKRAETEHKVSGKENQRSSPVSWITRKQTKKMAFKSEALMGNSWSKGNEGEGEGEEEEETEALVNCWRKNEEEKMGNERRERASCVRESFVEVKRSKEPQEDFKRSMVEMILEEEIFEAKGLEDLLHCYLTLNSPEFHRVIVGAFLEVWEFLFYDSHLTK